MRDLGAREHCHEDGRRNAAAELSREIEECRRVQNNRRRDAADRDEREDKPTPLKTSDATKTMKSLPVVVSSANSKRSIAQDAKVNLGRSRAVKFPEDEEHERVESVFLLSLIEHVLQRAEPNCGEGNTDRFERQRARLHSATKASRFIEMTFFRGTANATMKRGLVALRARVYHFPSRGLRHAS